MMACVADRLVASPFAVIGSIGVISETPNVYERLNREGIEFLTVTAGKYKRKLTPTKKPTKEDLEASQADVADILTLFKGFVGANRPSLDIDAVATGQVRVPSATEGARFGMGGRRRGRRVAVETPTPDATRRMMRIII